MSSRPSRDWAALSPEEAAAAARRDPVVVLPLGATEQHGPHLPTSTDCDIGEGLLAAALDRIPRDVDVWTLAPMRVGASQEHSRFPGTRSLTHGELVRSIVAQGAELAGAGVRRLVLSNSHGGNRSAVDAAALTLRAEHGLLVVKASWFRFARPADVELPEAEWRHGLHGGAVETAMMLHLRADRVRTDVIADFPSLGQELARTLRRLGPEGEASFAWLAGDLNPQGVTGDARLATAEIGERLVAHYGRVLAEAILDARDFPLERLNESGRGSGSPARAPVDERVAWELVRALEPGSGPSGGAAKGSRGLGAEPDGQPVRVRAASGLWIDVASDGSWAASTEPTPAARDLLDLYLPVRLPADLVLGQLGQSLDGRIATEGGASHYVTGPKDIERLHRLRALVDAVIVGAGTVALDDPRLTVRLVEGPNPVRVVLDPSRRLDLGRRVLEDGAARTIVVRREGGGAPVGAGYEELLVPAAEGGELDLEALLAALRARGLRRLLVEGGGVTVSGFLRAGLLDRLHLTVAPLLIGSGRPSLSLDPIESLDLALRPSWRRFTLGEDVLFDLDLRQSPA